MKVFAIHSHERPVRQVKFNHDGDLFFSCGDDARIFMYRTEDGEVIGKMEDKGASKSLDVSRDSENIIATFASYGVSIFKTETGEKVKGIAYQSTERALYIEFGFADLQFVVYTYSKDCHKIKLYNFKNVIESKGDPTHTKEILMPKDVSPMQVSFGPLNKTLYISTEQGEMIILDNTQDSSNFESLLIMRKQVHERRNGEILSFTFSQDQSMLITCSKDTTAKLLNPENLDEITVMRNQKPCRAASISPLYLNEEAPKYHVIIAGGQEARDVTTTEATEGGFSMKILNYVQNEELAQITGHFGPVHAVDFTPDGRTFVTCSEDGYVRLHRFAEDYYTRKYE